MIVRDYDYWDGKNWLILTEDNYLIIYYLHGEKHREDGPAEIWYYYDDGSIESEEYYFNDKLHRKDGPAVVIYHMDGSIKDKEYWFNNIKFDPEKLPFEMPIDSEEKKLYLELKI